MPCDATSREAATCGKPHIEPAGRRCGGGHAYGRRASKRSFNSYEARDSICYPALYMIKGPLRGPVINRYASPHTFAVSGSYALKGYPDTRLDVGLTTCRRFAAGGIRRLNRTACYGATTPCGGRRKHIIPSLGASPEAIEATPRIRGAPARKRFGVLQHAFFNSTRLVPEPGKFYFEGKGLLKTDRMSTELYNACFRIELYLCSVTRQ